MVDYQKKYLKYKKKYLAAKKMYGGINYNTSNYYDTYKSELTPDGIDFFIDFKNNHLKKYEEYNNNRMSNSEFRRTEVTIKSIFYEFTSKFTSEAKEKFEKLPVEEKIDQMLRETIKNIFLYDSSEFKKYLGDSVSEEDPHKSLNILENINQIIGDMTDTDIEEIWKIIIQSLGKFSVKQSEEFIKGVTEKFNAVNVNENTKKRISESLTNVLNSPKQEKVQYGGMETFGMLVLGGAAVTFSIWVIGYNIHSAKCALWNKNNWPSERACKDYVDHLWWPNWYVTGKQVDKEFLKFIIHTEKYRICKKIEMNEKKKIEMNEKYDEGNICEKIRSYYLIQEPMLYHDKMEIAQIYDDVNRANIQLFKKFKEDSALEDSFYGWLSDYNVPSDQAEEMYTKMKDSILKDSTFYGWLRDYNVPTGSRAKEMYTKMKGSTLEDSTLEDSTFYGWLREYNVQPNEAEEMYKKINTWINGLDDKLGKLQKCQIDTDSQDSLDENPQDSLDETPQKQKPLETPASQADLQWDKKGISQ